MKRMQTVQVISSSLDLLTSPPLSVSTFLLPFSLPSLCLPAFFRRPLQGQATSGDAFIKQKHCNFPTVFVRFLVFFHQLKILHLDPGISVCHQEDPDLLDLDLLRYLHRKKGMVEADQFPYNKWIDGWMMDGSKIEQWLMMGGWISLYLFVIPCQVHHESCSIHALWQVFAGWRPVPPDWLTLCF